MDNPIKHGSFTVERRYAAPPAKVFAAFAQAEARRMWLNFADGWTIHEYQLAEPTFQAPSSSAGSVRREPTSFSPMPRPGCIWMRAARLSTPTT